MKFAKIYTVLACAAAVAGFTACSDVTEPQYHKPDADSFSLNTPAMASQYLELTEEGTFEIVAASQPDYGFSAVTNYRIDVALTPEFTDFRQLTPSNNGGTLSRMTFTHEMVRLFFAEQLYRSQTILRTEPYHHD